MATVRLQLRRGTAAQWTSANPTLAAGEIGIETDTSTFKFGDGSTNWNTLDYALSSTVDDYVPTNLLAVANGVATLDASGTVPTAQLPALAKITVQSAANQTARLALTAQVGDIAIQADNGQSYVLATSPATVNGNWQALVGSEAVVDTVEAALLAGTGLDKTYDDSAGTITIDIDSTVATKTYADTAVSTHQADTTSVHGIADTSALVTKTYVDSADALLATLLSPTFTGLPAAPTASLGTNTTQLATTAFVKSEVDALIAAAPNALNTLNELAASIGNDANYATTVTNALADKVSQSGARAAISGGSGITYDNTTGVVAVNTSMATKTYVDTADTTLTNAVALKAPIDAPTFTGTVTLPLTTNIGDVSSTELAYVNGVTSGIQVQLDSKLASADASSTYAPKASPTFTGTVTLPSTTIIGDISTAELAYLANVTSDVQTQIDSKIATSSAASLYAPKADPTFTGTVTLPSTTIIGDVSTLELGYINGVTSGIQGQIDAKAPIDTPTFTGTVTLPSTTIIGEVSTLELGYINGVTSGIQGQIDAKAPLASPTFTGTVTLPLGTVTSSMILDGTITTGDVADLAVTTAKIADGSITTAKLGDDSVTTGKIVAGTIIDSDINAAAAIATSKISGLDTALGLKAPLASPTFTGTVSGITKSMVDLGSVDNTADTAKPVSTAQATAIATAKSEAIADATAQVNAVIASAPAALNTLDELAAALGDDANFATSVTTSLGLKAPLASPTFTGTVTVAAAGVAFTDGTQTKAGIPSLTTIGTEISAAYNLSTGGLALRDQLIPIAGTRAITIPTNATTAFPIGTSIDFYQASGTGANFVAADGTVTILRTPGLTLRTTHSSATLTKVAANTWLLAGDLTA